MGFLDTVFGKKGSTELAPELLGEAEQNRNALITQIGQGLRGFTGSEAAEGGTLAAQAQNFSQNVLGRSAAAGIGEATDAQRATAEGFFPTPDSITQFLQGQFDDPSGAFQGAAGGFQSLLDFSQPQTIQQIIEGITGPTVGALSSAFFGQGGPEEQLSARLAALGAARGGQGASIINQGFGQNVLQPATLQAASQAGQLQQGQSQQRLQALLGGSQGFAGLSQLQQGLLGQSQQQDIQNQFQAGGLQAQLLSPNDQAQQNFFQGLGGAAPISTPIKNDPGSAGLIGPIGAIAGFALGGPAGAAIGGQLGGAFSRGGDFGAAGTSSVNNAFLLQSLLGSGGGGGGGGGARGDSSLLEPVSINKSLTPGPGGFLGGILPGGADSRGRATGAMSGQFSRNPFE